MTKMQTTPATAADPTAAAAAAQFLTPVVLGLQALAVNGKQAHWNVRGANFIAIHELLDTLVDHAQDRCRLTPQSGSSRWACRSTHGSRPSRRRRRPRSPRASRSGRT